MSSGFGWTLADRSQTIYFEKLHVSLGVELQDPTARPDALDFDKLDLQDFSSTLN